MKRATATALSCVVLGWFYFTHLDDPWRVKPRIPLTIEM